MKNPFIIFILFNMLVTSCIHIPLYRQPIGETEIPFKYDELLGVWTDAKYKIVIKRKKNKYEAIFENKKKNKVFIPKHYFSAINDYLLLSIEIDPKLFGYNHSDLFTKKISSNYLILVLSQNDSQKLVASNLSEELIYRGIKEKSIKGLVELFSCVIPNNKKRKDPSIEDKCMKFDIKEAELKRVIKNYKNIIIDKDSNFTLNRGT